MTNPENLYDWAESVGLLEDDENSQELSYEDTLAYLDSISNEEEEWR